MEDVVDAGSSWVRRTKLSHRFGSRLNRSKKREEEEEAKKPNHGDEGSSSLDFSNLLIGPRFSHGAQSKIHHGRYDDEDVAVKMITIDQEGDHQDQVLAASLEKQVESETSLLSRLRHPNVVRLVGAHRKPPLHFVVTEYLPEGSLRHHLKKSRLSSQNVISAALDIARGMEYVHSKGVVHRDLKPENILIGHDFRLKIADFGIACDEGHLDSLTGTYRYMAPEYIKCRAKDIEKKPYGRKVDVYSFGLILWELVTGRVVFEGLSPEQTAFAVSEKNSRPVVDEGCPPAMRELMERCWSKQPEKRPEFKEVVKVLEQFEAFLAREGTLLHAKMSCQVEKKGKLHWLRGLGHQVIHA